MVPTYAASGPNHKVGLVEKEQRIQMEGNKMGRHVMAVCNKNIEEIGVSVCTCWAM